MALPAKTLDEVLALDADGRVDYFNEYSRHSLREPLLRCGVRVGEKEFYDNDVRRLRQKMERWLWSVKSNRRKKEKRDANRLHAD